MIVGIDLGTTNSLVGIWRDGRPILIPNALGEALTPSAVSIAEDGSTLVGMAARERRFTHPARTATLFKRIMGTSRETALGSRSFRPEELSALVLRSLKADAEAFLGEPVEQAVVTVPAYFNEVQRKATKTAGELAGLEVKRLLTEPTAAALAYGLDRPEADETVLVIDLGGGTFDVSLLRVFEGVTEVRATAGDTWLGGEDFVEAIVEDFMRTVGARAGVPTTPGSTAQAVLRRQAELVKRRLGEADCATLQLSQGDRIVEHELTRARFEELSEPLLARLRFPIERALRDARVDPDQVASVILAGGASRMPMVRKMIARIFRRMPLQTINPEQVVALGAAIRAGMLMRAADLAERVMTDVAPFTLGIDVCRTLPDGQQVDAVFAPIIERSTVIPVSRVRRFYTSRDNQTRISVGVYQGESQFVADNIKLGEFTVAVPSGRHGEQAIDVRFTYDSSGLLEVETVAVSTGVKHRLVIEGNPGTLSPSEIERRLAALAGMKVHPRDQAENQALVARAKRLYEERLRAERDEVGDALVAFVAALDGQELDRIRLARKALEELLVRLDGDFFV
jgi:molecular chaperone HscC